MDGEHFPLAELEVGENAPPMHVRCRSTIIAYDGEPTGKRTARDSDGRSIKIPAEMSYSDWKAIYIDRTTTLSEWQKNHLQNSSESAIIYAGFTGGSQTPTDRRLAAVNPASYTDNCYKCAIAYEMLCRGCKVTAKPVTNSKKDVELSTAGNYLKVFENPQTIKCTGDIKGTIEEYMRKWGIGSRAMVSIVWEDGGGHVFVTENRGGKIAFIDPQSADPDVSEYFSRPHRGFALLTRMDKLKLTDTFSECVEVMKR